VVRKTRWENFEQWVNLHFCHYRERGNLEAEWPIWIPACAGMTSELGIINVKLTHYRILSSAAFREKLAKTPAPAYLPKAGGRILAS
jgi:hypothetical protein